MAAQEPQEFVGRMTYNIVNLVKNGSKKMFNGFIVLKDVNGIESSYKVISFRTHVIYQSEVLGEKGMTGKIVKVLGTFKENTWNGETTFQLMAEKIYIEGMEQLATAAENSEKELPQSPGGTLGSAPVAAPAGAIIQGQPAVQQSAPITPQAPQTPSAPVMQTTPQAPITPSAPVIHDQPFYTPAAPQVIDTTTVPTVPTMTTPIAPIQNAAPTQSASPHGPGAIAGGYFSRG